MKIITYEDRLSDRQLLRNVVPLDFPFALQVYVSHACNFKCYYCLQNQPWDHGRNFPKLGTVMTFDDFRTCIDNICSGGVLKKLIFSGCGEPLMNRHLSDMVRYARRIEVAEKIEVVTNGALLTREISNALISAGLDSLRISMQGLNERQYKENAGIDVDFSEFLERIGYFYQNRGNCRVYVKIIDEMLQTDEERHVFENTFGGLSDGAYIENIIPLHAFETADIIDGHESEMLDKIAYSEGECSK